MSDQCEKSLRSLSMRQARNCEEAREPVCKCRCGGTLHGAKRGSGDSFFNGLPDNDPHFVPSKQYKADKKKRENDEKWRKRFEALSAVHVPHER